MAADTLDELIPILQVVFGRLTKFNLPLYLVKLQLCKPEISYAGFNLNENGHSPSQQNIDNFKSYS